MRDSLNPVREAFRRTRPAEKPHAHAKYWQDLSGPSGGPVRRPMLQLTEAEEDAVRTAFEGCGLKLSDQARPVRRLSWHSACDDTLAYDSSIGRLPLQSTDQADRRTVK